MVAQRVNEGSIQNLITNNVGSVEFITNSNFDPWTILRYDAWGKIRDLAGAGLAPGAFTYTGQRQDSYINLMFYGSRWYDPALGRFASPDTIIPDPNNPLSYDRYQYVDSNPVMRNDPTGHCPFCIIIGITIVAAIILPWLSGDTCHNCNSSNPTTPEQFNADVTQRMNGSADILLVGTTIAGGAQALNSGSTDNSTINETTSDDSNANFPAPGSLSTVDARNWYLDQEKKIPGMIDQSLPLEDQAKQAFDMRNQIRTDARNLMADRAEADKLARDEPNLTWDQIVQRYQGRGYSGDNLWKEIIAASQRSRQSVNQSLGLGDK